MALKHDIGLRRRITLLLPNAGLFNTTALKNAAYGLGVRGFGRSEAKKLALRALAAVGLGHKTKQNALTLSSGESQRLALARAVAIEPELLFLDEPTASVDPYNKEVIEDAILGMKGRRGIIMTTHDEAQAFRLADVVLVLENGVLREAGR